MSLLRFQKLEEEHGALEGETKLVQQQNAQASFVLFYTCALGLHGILSGFCVLYIVLAGSTNTDHTFSVCFSNRTNFLELYTVIPIIGTFQKANATFNCVLENENASLYLACVMVAAAFLAAGLTLHKKLPNALRVRVMPHIDAVICPLVYMINMFGPYFDFNVDAPYVLSNLHSGQVRACVRAWPCSKYSCDSEQDIKTTAALAGVAHVPALLTRNASSCSYSYSYSYSS